MQVESANLLSEISQIAAREDLQGGGDVSCQPNVSDRRNVLFRTVLYCMHHISQMQAKDVM